MLGRRCINLEDPKQQHSIGSIHVSGPSSRIAIADRVVPVWDDNRGPAPFGLKELSAARLAETPLGFSVVYFGAGRRREEKGGEGRGTELGGDVQNCLAFSGLLLALRCLFGIPISGRISVDI